MNKALQRALIGAYGIAVRLGATTTPAGRAIFRKLYFSYKRHFEAREADALRPYASPASLVVDVGANQGFFTLRFAEWVGSGGKVIAIEPEQENFEALKAATGRHSNVEPIQAAAAEIDGELRLEIDPLHPGNHKLSERGRAVRAIKLDSLLKARGWPEVSLIKVDVQGAEERVVSGARECLERFHPALYVELCARDLGAQGSSVASLLERLARLGYAVYELKRAGPPERRSARWAEQREGYFDVLLLWERTPPESS